jgi:hypothetical protein
MALPGMLEGFARLTRRARLCFTCLNVMPLPYPSAMMAPAIRISGPILRAGSEA